VQHPDALFVGSVRRSEGEVVAQRTGQHRGILLHIPDLGAKGLAI